MAAGWSGKEEPVSMHGGREEKAMGILGAVGSPDTFLAGDLEIKFFLNLGRKIVPLGGRFM